MRTQYGPEPAVALIAVLPTVAEPFCDWFRPHVEDVAFHSAMPTPSAVTGAGPMVVNPASSWFPSLLTVKLWMSVPPCPSEPVNVSVTRVGVGPVVLLFELFVQPLVARASATSITDAGKSCRCELIIGGWVSFVGY